MAGGDRWRAGRRSGLLAGMKSTLRQETGCPFPLGGRTPLLAHAMPSGPIAVPRARRAVKAMLTRFALDADRAHDVLLAVSELATNAISHAPGPRELRVYVGSGLLLIEVRDGAGELISFPDTGSATPEAERGRGLALVVTLSAGQCGARELAMGKGVWFAVPVGPGASRPGWDRSD